jgi:hypothetical protein
VVFQLGGDTRENGRHKQKGDAVQSVAKVGYGQPVNESG